MSSKNISDLREAMFEAIQALKDGKMSVEQAKAVSELGQVIINTAKVEVEHIKAVGATTGSGFIPEQVPPLPSGVVGITQHRIQG